ncbi:MAG TPA: GNAT family N-acetyltransferase [Thermoleophilaceae bacterium]|nr:GNAT family N-acetyltransferase [Thermoleophilaceae bacterium]
MADATTTDALTVRHLEPADALALSDLLAAYVTETKRGAPRQPDRLYVEQLLSKPEVEGLGAWLGEDLVGFALFFDLPEVVTGRRMGQVDELFVDVRHRRDGIATALLHALEEEGRRRGWGEIRWTAPYGSTSGKAFSERRGIPARGETYHVVLRPDDPTRDD